jgi:hypothetical protein
MTKKKASLLALVAIVVLSVVAYTRLTIFVIPPIGAVPEGRTLIISRMNNTQFIDSADAMCERMQGGVSLLCRGVLLGAVSEKSRIYLRLPYSESLYLISTNGQTYDR